MLPSLFASEENSQLWSVPRAALYGAGLGLLAALIRIFGPFHADEAMLPPALEIAMAAVAFALLSVGAALLRNALARRLKDLSR
jgi:hypothetical protein